MTAQTAVIQTLARAVDVLSAALCEAPSAEDLAAVKESRDKQARIVGECITLLLRAEAANSTISPEDLRAVLDACRINPK